MSRIAIPSVREQMDRADRIKATVAALPQVPISVSEAREMAKPYAVEWQGTRRDTCYAVGEKMLELNTQQAAEAWSSLGRHLVRLGDRDIPKFMDMITGINAATMSGGIRGHKVK